MPNSGTYPNGMPKWEYGDKETMNDRNAANKTVDDGLGALAKKLDLVQLWGGQWGGVGAAALPVAGISGYSQIAFVINGVFVICGRGVTMFPFNILQYGANNSYSIKALHLALSGEVLTVAAARVMTINATGVYSFTDDTGSPITGIYGVKSNA